MNTVEAMFTISVLEAIVVTLIGAILGILFYKLLYEKEPKATTEYLELLDECAELKIKLYKCQVYINALEKQAIKPKKNIREIPKGTIEAVKLAMKISHPDNNGNREDFEKYKRAYLILTGKEKI